MILFAQFVSQEVQKTELFSFHYSIKVYVCARLWVTVHCLLIQSLQERN